MPKHQLEAVQTAHSLCPSPGLQLKSLSDRVAPTVSCPRPASVAGHTALSAKWRNMTTWTIFTSR